MITNSDKIMINDQKHPNHKINNHKNILTIKHFQIRNIYTPYGFIVTGVDLSLQFSSNGKKWTYSYCNDKSIGGVYEKKVENNISTKACKNTKNDTKKGTWSVGYTLGTSFFWLKLASGTLA